MKTVLVVAAHPDDEILGCGATAARLIKEGCVVSTLILGEGATSRDQKRDKKKRNKEISALQKTAIRANGIIGVKKVYFGGLPDNRFDSVDLLDVIKIIEEVKRKGKPDTIFTHFAGDLNIDHQITYKAVLTATRPMASETVKAIYAFEVLSSTEWAYPLSFSPDTFFDISGTLDRKIKAMEEYKTEIRSFPHPRSSKALRVNAESWGFKTGLGCAEAFQCVRQVR